MTDRVPMTDVQELTDLEQLTAHNERFVEATRRGTWAILQPVLAPLFEHLDGATGEVWEIDRYMRHLRHNPAPTLRVDQLVIHINGNTASVSARSLRLPATTFRYLDTYERRDGEWLCVHSCRWPVDTQLG
jgi:Domain of unknown function (DUF4440)